MNDDDIFIRAGKTIALMSGAYLFLYLVIVGTQRPPIGYALKFVQFFEAATRWLFVIAVIVAVLFFALSIIEYITKEKQQKCKRQEAIKQKEEQARQNAIREVEEVKQRELKQEQEKTARELRQQELNQLRIKKENYLKNRSAEDATKDALRDFV